VSRVGCRYYIREVWKLYQFFREHVWFGCGVGRHLARVVKLQIVKAPIVAGLFEQLGVGADFLDVAIFEHNNLVRGQNGGKPVRDRDDGATGGKFLERLLDLLLRSSVER